MLTKLLPTSTVCCEVPHRPVHQSEGRKFFWPERVLGGAQGKNVDFFSKHQKGKKVYATPFRSKNSSLLKLLLNTVSDSFVCEYTRTQTVKQSISARLSLRHLYS
jgi:hypothetical protein